jgi:uncharacterized protein YjlB
MKRICLQYFVNDNGIFPNNVLPVLHYKKVISIPVPACFSYAWFRFIFFENDWTNNHKSGIAMSHRYHSNTHKVLGVCSGRTMLQLGGENGMLVSIVKGDVLIIPAGVAYKNLGHENNVTCVAGYTEGIKCDVQYGRLRERPVTDISIALAPFPGTDPVLGRDAGLVKIWKKVERMAGAKYSRPATMRSRKSSCILFSPQYLLKQCGLN